MATSQADLQKVRAYAETLKGEERSAFIGRVKGLKGEDSITKLASRLPETVAQSDGGIVKDIADSFSGAGIEAARGFQNASGDIFEKLNYITQKASQVTGIPASGFFGDVADATKKSAEGLPETRLGDAAKATYQTMGAAVPQTAEFLPTSGLLNSVGLSRSIKGVFGDIPAANQLSNSIAIGVQSAVDEFSKTESYGRAIQSFANGTSIGLGVSVAAEAIPKAIELGKVMGRNAAKAFLKAVTGDEKFAEAFVKNPWKFNLNPFQKVPSLADVEAENAQKITSLRNEYDAKISDMKIHNAEKKSVLASEINNESYALSTKNRELKRILTEKGRADVARTAEESHKAYQGVVDTAHASLMDDFNGVLNKVELIRDQKGKMVGQAIENVTNKDPFSSIGAFRYLKKLEKVAKDNKMVIEAGVVKPRFGNSTVEPEVISFMQSAVDETKDLASGFHIPLGAAQAKKELWQRFGYSGSNKVHNVAKQMSGALDPANMIDDIVGNNIGPEIEALKKANTEFSEMMPKYREAIKSFTRLDAQGKPIPDFQKALNAVRSGDRVTLKQMAKADSLLPPEDRILPKVYQASKQISDAENTALANVKLAKRKASENISKLNVEIREKEFLLKQRNRERRFVEAQKHQQALDNMRNVEKAKLEKTVKDLEAYEQDIRNQNIARSFTAPGGGRRTLQMSSVLGAAGTAIANPALSALATGGAVALSPRVAAGAVKGAASVLKPGAQALNSISEAVKSALTRLY